MRKKWNLQRISNASLTFLKNQQNTLGPFMWLPELLQYYHKRLGLLVCFFSCCGRHGHMSHSIKFVECLSCLFLLKCLALDSSSYVCRENKQWNTSCVHAGITFMWIDRWNWSRGCSLECLDIIAGLVRRDQHFLTSEIVAVDRFESWLTRFSRFSQTLSGHSEWHML